jgi:hypothetical protein
MSQIKTGPTAEQLVNETDHVQLSRLVTEHAWRADNGRADTIHELYIDDGQLIVGRHLCVDVQQFLSGAGSSLRNPHGESSVMSAATCGSLAMVRTRPKARLSLPSSWSRDLGRRLLNHSASVRITTGSFAPKKDGDLSRVVGLSSSHEVTF